MQSWASLCLLGVSDLALIKKAPGTGTLGWTLRSCPDLGCGNTGPRDRSQAGQCSPTLAVPCSPQLLRVEQCGPLRTGAAAGQDGRWGVLVSCFFLHVALLCVCVCVCVCVLLWIEPRASRRLGKLSTTKPHPQPFFVFFVFEIESPP
jgi:hypothetical protein